MSQANSFRDWVDSVSRIEDKEALVRGARQILESDACMQVLAHMERNVILAILDTPVEENEVLIDLKAFHTGLSNFRRGLEMYVQEETFESMMQQIRGEARP